MATYNKFIDSVLASGSNNGSDMDNAWQSIETGFEYNYHLADTIVWVRRRSYFTGATSHVTPNGSSDGGLNSWIRFVAWPRTEISFTGTFTNGSTTVGVTSGVTPTWDQHCGRKIKNDADGKWYIITNISGSNFIIDREYAGTTATDGACTIEEDEMYDTAQALDDSTWTIKKADWNADSDSLPYLDFTNTAYQYQINGSYMIDHQGLHFKNGGNGQTIYSGVGSNTRYKYCIMSTTTNQQLLTAAAASTRVYLDQCILYGNSTGSGQNGIYGGAALWIKNSALYNLGGYGLSCENSGMLRLDNVNIGVEAANDYADVVLGSFDWNWKDVKLGSATNILNGLYYRGSCSIQNYGKVLGAWRSFNCNGYTETVAVVAGSGDPEKRTGGSDYVLAIRQNESTESRSYISDEIVLDIVGQDRPLLISSAAESHTYRFYLQANGLSTAVASEFYVEAEYIDAYDDTSEYHYTTIKSDELISARSGATDWTQYVEVTVSPAVASVIKFRFKTAFYDSDGILYLDPLPIIS